MFSSLAEVLPGSSLLELLHEEDIHNLLIIEIGDELGGRMRSYAFAGYLLLHRSLWRVRIGLGLLSAFHRATDP